MFAAFALQVIWMHANTAEMAKHVLNGFLAITIAFANEVGTLCEMFGVDPADVSKSLLTEGRIGALPLRYGEPYSGGTLSRDVETLVSLARTQNRYLPLFQTINPSNELHKVRYEVKDFRARMPKPQEVAAGAD